MHDLPAVVWSYRLSIAVGAVGGRMFGLSVGRCIGAVVAAAVVGLFCASGPWAEPSDGEGIYVSPQFFGQHLMFDSSLTPALPVRAVRLWDSNTQWCQMDSGTSNQYTFGQLDALLAQAARLNADVEFTFGYTPKWAVNGSYPEPSIVDQCSGDSASMAPAEESYWTNFVTALVTHARGKIHAYELWNEADYSAFWSGGVATLVRMSVDAAATIHRIDPSALVLSPSVTDTPEGYTFLHQYLSSLPPGTIDAVAVHSYTNGAWPEQAVPAEMDAVRAALPSVYAHTPIWSTEGGWGLNSQFSSSPSDRRAFVARYDLQMLLQGVARSYWYAYPNTEWGTLWDGIALTPAGAASNALYAWLTDEVLDGCTTADGNLWTCDLTTSGGKSARIVWVTSTPVVNYPTSGYATLQTLSGTSSPTASQPITVTTEPVLLSGDTVTTEPVLPASDSSASGAPTPASDGTTPTSRGTSRARAPAPKLTMLRLIPSRFEPPTSGASVLARGTAGTLVSFRLDRAATVTFTVQRSRPGRLVKGSCRADTHAKRTATRCTRWSPVNRSFTWAARAGANSLRFTGRIGGHKLPPRSYRLTAQPSDRSGTTGQLAQAAFTIRRQATALVVRAPPRRRVS